MATIAHPTSSGLGVIAPSDAMDLHSDNGYDLGDGDIDLEFESTATVYHQDDNDLLLQDAAPDLGLNLHTTLPDQDDFMADKDDLIEEDEVDYGDVEVEDAVQPSPSDHAIAEEATAEEDLIDYSDEEEEPPNMAQEASPHIEEALETQDTIVNPNISQPSLYHAASTSLDQGVEGHSYDYHEEEHDNVRRSKHNTNQPWDSTETDWEQLANNEYSADFPADNQDEHHQQQEKFEAQSDDKTVDQPTQFDELVSSDKIAQVEQGSPVEQYDQVHEQLQVHPVTVNYDGSEFWLFKPSESESEDNEDWLLSDRSIQGKLLNELFQACRAALHTDINQDTEIGFRFDHFHNLEIYEDSTACLFVKLEDLIITYLKLHAQDGTPNPESFYITLQFRPRVSTLLGELNKAVRDRVGYSGLNTAVAAGQTAFNTPFSNNEQNDDTYENWEEQELEHNDGTVQPNEQYEDVEETASLETPTHKTGHDGQYLEHHSPIALHAIAVNDNMSNTEVSLAKDLEQDGTGIPSNDAQPSHRKQSPEEEGDIIEYSDEEDDTNLDRADQADQMSAPISAHDPSSGSSTVQGDDDEQQDHTTLLESQEDTEQLTNSNGGGLEIGQGDEEAHPEFDAEFPNYEDTGVAPEAYDDEAFNQAFEQDYDEEAASQPYGTQEYETQELYAADNSYYDDEAGTNLHEDLTFPNAVEDNSNIDDVSNQTVGNENFVDVDDTFGSYVDETTTTIAADRASLHYGTNDAIEEDYINYEDDEDGTVEQRTVATSTAAQPIAASSSGPDHAGSPQGLKRSIDEVGNGLDVGTDLSDAKRPRV